MKEETTISLVTLFQVEELESRLENKWIAEAECACLCDCDTGETPEKL